MKEKLTLLPTIFFIFFGFLSLFAGHGPRNEANAADAYEMSTSLRTAIDYFSGTTGQVDLEKGKQLAFKASEQGDPLATMWIALGNSGGIFGFPKDEVRAKEMAEKVIEQVKSIAGTGNHEAMFLLGAAYQESLGVSKDLDEAVSWYEKAVEKGNIFAMNGLGIMYYKGQQVVKNHKEAVSLFRKAADKGAAFAMNNLGSVYDFGAGVEKDYQQAFSWYQRAADKGNLSAMAEMGRMYRLGRGVKKDQKVAVSWTRKSAEKDSPLGMYALGYCYMQAEGVEWDDEQALKWFRKAAEKDFVPAMLNIGWLYINDRSDMKDKEVISWLKKAEKLGDSKSRERARYYLDRIE